MVVSTVEELASLGKSNSKRAGRPFPLPHPHLITPGDLRGGMKKLPPN
jgi:hypothetical protein